MKRTYKEDVLCIRFITQTKKGVITLQCHSHIYRTQLNLKIVKFLISCFSLEEEVRSLREKVKKLAERMSAVENLRANTKSEDEVANELVAHLKESDSTQTVQILAKHIFTEEEIINSSRTAKKTVKSGDNPRPPLNQEKIERLERLVILKTNISKAEFIKKFENFQKVLRRK